MTEDGAETDLDLGHYERFIDENLNKYSNLTTGKVYWNVLNKERQRRISGRDGAGHSPHHQRDQELYLQSCGKRPNADVVITEIGGTTGDIESQPFLEAIRQVGIEAGHGKLSATSTSRWCPISPARTSIRSKPTQHSCQGTAEHGHRAERHRAACR